MPTYSRMAPGEWSKVNSQTNEPRLDILRRVIKSGEAIPNIKGTEIKVLNTPENLEAVDRLEKENKTQKLDTNVGTIASSEIGKSPVFGGAGGGAGMTGQTAVGESLQCVYCAAIVAGRVQPFETYQASDLKRTMSRAKLDGTSFEKMMELDPSWHWSAYWTAKELLKKGYINKSMTFHRGDKVMKSVYAAKNKAMINSRMKPLTDDKWNPGDIWAVADGYNPERDLPTGSIQELNTALVKAFNDKKLVGISLKKVTNESKIKCVVLNADNKSDDIHKFDRAELMVTFARKGSEFWRSKKGDIFFDKGAKMDVRTSSAFSAPNVEIQLKTARGGRAGWDAITYAIQKRLNKKVPENSQLKTIAKDLNAKGEKSRYAKVFYNMAKKVHPGLDEKEFYEGLSRPAADIHSKIAAMYLISHLVDNKANGKADLIVTDLVNYAGSKLDISSIYAKVYE